MKLAGIVVLALSLSPRAQVRASVPVQQTTTVHAFVPWWVEGAYEMAFPAFDVNQGTLDAVTVSWHYQSTWQATVGMNLPGGCPMWWTNGGPYVSFDSDIDALGHAFAFPTQTHTFQPPGGTHVFPMLYGSLHYEQTPFRGPNIPPVFTDASGVASVRVHVHKLAPSHFLRFPPCLNNGAWSGRSEVHFEAWADVMITYLWH